MTKGKIAYWTTTVLLCAIYGMSAIMYTLQRPLVEEGFAIFGYPGYLVTVLIVVKILAILAILSRVSVRLSDLAYAGMLFHLLLAVTAHVNIGDGGFTPGLVALALLATSFLTQNLARKRRSPNVPRAAVATAGLIAGA